MRGRLGLEIELWQQWPGVKRCESCRTLHPGPGFMLGPQRAVAGNAGLITCCKAASSAVQIASPEDAAPDIPLMGLPQVGPADLRSSANFQRRTRLYSHSLEQMETVLLSGRGWLGWLTEYCVVDQPGSGPGPCPPGTIRGTGGPRSSPASRD